MAAEGKKATRDLELTDDGARAVIAALLRRPADNPSYWALLVRELERADSVVVAMAFEFQGADQITNTCMATTRGLHKLLELARVRATSRSPGRPLEAGRRLAIEYALDHFGDVNTAADIVEQIAKQTGADAHGSKPDRRKRYRKMTADIVRSRRTQ